MAKFSISYYTKNNQLQYAALFDALDYVEAINTLLKALERYAILTIQSFSAAQQATGWLPCQWTFSHSHGNEKKR